MSIDAIRDLVHRYADAVVHQNEQKWAATWAPEAVWELPRGRSAEGRDAIVELWRTATGALDLAVQTVLNGTATFDGETASGRWYLQEHVWRPEGTNILLAYYDDTYAVVDGAWCFTSRRMVSLYRGPADLSGPCTPPPGFRA